MARMRSMVNTHRIGVKHNAPSTLGSGYIALICAELDEATCAVMYYESDLSLLYPGPVLSH